jgi:hypothetical protein
MGRGLSELQKSILIIAYLNRDTGIGRVTNREILIKAYNFHAHEPGPCHTSGSPQIFDRKEIGLSRYKSASVSVVKAFNRLAVRGLARRKHNYGIILTEKGGEVGKELLLNADNSKNRLL